MKGIYADPKVKQLYKNLADVYIESNDMMSAIGVLQDAVSFMPDENYLRFALAQVYIMDSRLDIAIDELDKVLESDHDDLAARYELARLYFELGVYGSAIENYELVLEKITDNADLFFNTGCANEASGDVDKAMSNFLKAVNE
jgi:tetratricopeptide (TPR) repeat protein